MAYTKLPRASVLLLLLLVLGMHQMTWASMITIATFPILPTGDNEAVSTSVTVSDKIASSLLESGTPVLPWKAVSSEDVSTMCHQIKTTGRWKFRISLIDSESRDPPLDLEIEIHSIAGCGASTREAGTEAVLTDSHGVKSVVVCPKDAGSHGCPIYKTVASVAAPVNNIAGSNSSFEQLDDCEYDCTIQYNCFPGEALVRMANGKLKQMMELNLGDKIAVRKVDGSIAYEDIYAFGHKDASAVSEFLMITMVPAVVENLKGQESRSLELSALHFAPISSGPREQEIVYRRAQAIRVGDTMWAISKEATEQDSDLRLVPYVVTGVATTMKRGLYNPFTVTGTVVVNGVVASVHSDWFLDGIFDVLGLTHLLPFAYQVVLAPPRMLYTILGKDCYITVYTWLDARINLIQLLRDYSGRSTSIAMACIAAPFLSLLSSTKIKEFRKNYCWTNEVRLGLGRKSGRKLAR